MMIQNQLRQEILHEIDRLPDERQHRALRLIRRLATPRGAPVEALLPYFGCIDDESAKEMTMAIEEECEQVDPDGW